MPTDSNSANLQQSPQQQASPRWLYLSAVLLVFGALMAVVLLSLRRRDSTGRDTARRTGDVQRGPLVRTVTVVWSSPSEHLDLLGEARPFASVTLYAKVSGYLGTILVDKGDHVAAGAILATIESPETDRAYAGVKADYDNKVLTASRIAQLLARKLVSPQENDQARTEAAIAHERLAGLAEERAYETLRAPFAGTITARYADPGALVQNAATSQTNALPVVTVSQINRLRIYVYLDQGDAAHVRPGTHATITLQERPDVRVAASVTRVSGELDQKTRKMLTEIDIDNRDGKIVPGSFVQVMLDIPNVPRPQAPTEALIVRGGHTYVASLGDDARVHFHQVVVANNDGRVVTFASGVHTGERLAVSLGDGIPEGTLVRPDTASVSTASTPSHSTSGP